MVPQRLRGVWHGPPQSVKQFLQPQRACDALFEVYMVCGTGLHNMIDSSLSFRRPVTDPVCWQEKTNAAGYIYSKTAIWMSCPTVPIAMNGAYSIRESICCFTCFYFGLLYVGVCNYKLVCCLSIINKVQVLILRMWLYIVKCHRPFVRNSMLQHVAHIEGYGVYAYVNS